MLLALPPNAFMLPRLLGRNERMLTGRPQVTRWLAVGVPQGRTCELPLAKGRMVVHCRQGQVWITHDGDQRDIVLRPNQSYTVDRDQRMTAFAMHGDCSLELQVNV
jgi:hypothetical protein